MRILYIGKTKDMTLKELWLVWKFGRKIETIESVDVNRN